MSLGSNIETWSSAREHTITLEESSFIAALQMTDRNIGKEQRRAQGVLPRRSFMERVANRLRIEFRKSYRYFILRPIEFLKAQWFRRLGKFLGNSRWQPRGSNPSKVEIIHLNNANLRKRLETTDSEFWVLTRDHAKLFPQGVRAIRRVLSHSSAIMWFGDSRNRLGRIERRSEFNRLLLRQVDALGPVVVIRTNVLRRIPQAIPPHLWPLYVGLNSLENEIELIPEILALGDVTVSNLHGSEKTAASIVRSELQRSHIQATVTEVSNSRRMVAYDFGQIPYISIIIPTRGTANDSGRAFVVDAVDSIIQKSSYANFEVIIVADDDTPQSVINTIDAFNSSSVKWVRWSKPFNFSEKMNLGAACASGEYLLFLNDDTEVVSPHWMEDMLSLIGVDRIGYAGALLFFDDQTIQHAGHVYKGGAGHIGFGEKMRLKDPNQLTHLDRKVSGVTAACSLVSKSLFERVGGFSVEFPGSYNDVDLSMKLALIGVDIAVAGSARLYHFESKSRDATVKKSEILLLQARWRNKIQHDRHYRGLEN
ncbi:GT2 family glycosyltransferase [Aurantimicrobium minutum]|uniref:glycosyltransferase family 2 protein n=1 Tax=Aurantimicrobium minutum TaxID=708131 RepID=UPI002473A32B|nr:glycosyltransferase [Aurantimicrobium minutum]MDH6531768.1 GT2 family glycosyltransferase [Aurantimicrobium minutum]